MSYLLPQDVVSPKDRWTLLGIVYDAGEHATSVVFGEWDGDPCLATRWNGSLTDPQSHNSKGHPISNFQPVWFILPDYIAQATMKELLMFEALGDGQVNHDVLLQAITTLNDKR